MGRYLTWVQTRSFWWDLGYSSRYVQKYVCVSGQADGIHSRVQVWQKHSCFPSCCISFPVDNQTLQPLLLHSFVFPRVPAADQHSAQPSGTTFSLPLLCRAQLLVSDVVPKLHWQNSESWIRLAQQESCAVPQPWAYPVICMFWHLHGGVYSRYSLVTHHKYSSEGKPSCLLLMTHFHSFPSRCWAGTCLSFFVSYWVLLFCDKCYSPKASFLAEFKIKLLSHIHWQNTDLGEKGRALLRPVLGTGCTPMYLNVWELIFSLKQHLVGFRFI